MSEAAPPSPLGSARSPGELEEAPRRDGLNQRRGARGGDSPFESPELSSSAASSKVFRSRVRIGFRVEICTCANANTSYANALHCLRTYVRTYVFESVFKAVAVGALRPGMWRRSRSYVQGPPPRQHATVRTYVRTYVRPRILRCPKVINQVGGRIRTCVRIHARMYVPSRVRVASTEKKIAHVVPVRRAIVAGCASCPVCASCTRRRAHPTYVYVRTYVRTYFSMHAGTYVRTYVRSSERRVMCARCARSRQYVRYVRAHVRSSHSRVMCASCARSRKCVRTYVRTYVVRTSQIRAMNVRTDVRTYVCQLSQSRQVAYEPGTHVRTYACKTAIVVQALSLIHI